VGGTTWGYWTPYGDGDVESALDTLRASVFNSGEYHLRDIGFGPDFDSLQEEWDDDEDPDERAEYEAEYGVDGDEEPWRNRRPTSIADLLLGNAEDGTHSILDMHGVSGSPEWGMVAPLSDGETAELYGDQAPSRATVESKVRELQSLRSRWFGTYVIAYDQGAPSHFFFAGCSGD
jgi:hypothetical protein